MYPSQPQPQPQPEPTPQPQPTPQFQPGAPAPAPIDYLNQIAPVTPKRMNFTRKQWMLFGGLAIAALLTIILSIIASSSHNPQATEQLAARLISTSTIATNAQVNLKSTELRALNSNLQTYLINTNRDIAAPLMETGIKVTKLDKKIVAAESGKAMVATLEDARLNAVYDNTYASEMAHQLDTVVILMQQIYRNTGNKDLKEFLTSAYTNLQPIQKQFSNFNSTNS